MSNNDQHVTIRLSFVPANDGATPARVGDVARDTATALRTAGYTLTPAPTGERGGPVYNLIMGVAKAVHDNKEMLVALISLATPIVKHLLESHQKTKQSLPSPPAPLEVIVVVGGASAAVQSLEEANDTALLQQLLAVQPNLADTVTRDSPLNITVKVPSVPARRKR